MTKMQLAALTAKLLPEALSLVRTLLERYRGDVDEVRKALRRIPDHGARLDDEEDELDERMRVAEARRRGDP